MMALKSLFYCFEEASYASEADTSLREQLMFVFLCFSSLIVTASANSSIFQVIVFIYFYVTWITISILLICTFRVQCTKQNSSNLLVLSLLFLLSKKFMFIFSIEKKTHFSFHQHTYWKFYRDSYSLSSITKSCKLFLYNLSKDLIVCWSFACCFFVLIILLQNYLIYCFITHW